MANIISVAPSTRRQLETRRRPRTPYPSQQPAGGSFGGAFIQNPLAGPAVFLGQRVGANVAQGLPSEPYDLPTTGGYKGGGSVVQRGGGAEDTSTPRGPRPSAMDSMNSIARINQEVDQIARQFQAFQQLESEGLSPAARDAVRQLKEDAAIQIGRINDEIARLQSGAAMYQDVSARGRGLVEGTLATARAGVNAASDRITAGIDQATGTGVSAVRESVARGAAEAVGALPELQYDSPSGPDFYFGGAASPNYRAALEEQASADIREIEGLVGGSISNIGNLSQDIARLSNQAANSQLDLLGVTDEISRLEATTVLQNRLETDIRNLVQNRQDIERETSRIISGIERDDSQQRMGQIDQFGLGFSTDPGEIYVNHFIDEFSSVAQAKGWVLNPRQEEEFAAALEEWVGLPSNDPKRESAIQLWASQLNADEDELTAALQQSTVKADRVWQQLQQTGLRSKLEPGSLGMAWVIAQAAQEAGLPPEAVNEWANSNVLHALIATQSGGRVGYQGGGNLFGIGGLPLDTYEMMGVDYESIKGDAVQEMAALVSYLYAVYGDPRAAAESFMESKSFGTIPDDYISVRPPVGSEMPRRGRGGRPGRPR